MTDEKKLITMKKSDLNATAEEIKFLSYKNKLLVPCEIRTNDEEVEFNFNIGELINFDCIRCGQDEKYRLLANCSDLFVLSKEFEFSLNPQNLMFDVNLCPKVLLRDKCEDAKSQELFLQKYKSLIACFLYPKYTYEDYYNGGNDLFKKHTELSFIFECENVNELKLYLLKTYQEHRNNQNNMIFVSKKKKNVVKLCIPILIVLVIVFGVFTSVAYLKIIPFKEVLLTADEQYLSGSYIEVQETLSNISVDKLPFSQKYILSRSYVSSESMTQEQKEVVLDGLTINTDEAVIDYWIYIGRLDFDNAIDQAQKIGDDELLLYSYIKQRSDLESDNKISGEEKTGKLNQIDEKISSITDDLTNEDSENIEPSSMSISEGSTFTE